MSERKILSIDDIITAEDVQFLEIEVPELKGSVRIGTLTAEDMIEWSEANEGAKKTAGIRLLLKSLVDEQGNRIGKDEHIAAFKKKSAGVLQKLVMEVLKLNGLNVKEPVEEAKNV